MSLNWNLNRLLNKEMTLDLVLNSSSGKINLRTLTPFGNNYNPLKLRTFSNSWKEINQLTPILSPSYKEMFNKLELRPTTIQDTLNL